MLNFEFQNKTEIIFGIDSHKKIGSLISKYSHKIMIHYGSERIKQSGLYDELIRYLDELGIKYFEFGGVVGNPRISLVNEGIKQCKQHGVDFILAIGGGSVIDSSKAIAAGYYYEGDVWDLFIKDIPIDHALPVGVILTMPAAGSESSSGAVITNEIGQWKKDIGSNVLRPVFAILNPELTLTLSAYQTFCGITDMMAHVMERYFTNVKNVSLTDRLCESLLITMIEQGKILLDQPNHIAARSEIMWAGTLAHNDLVGTGRQGDWSSHIIEHELSGMYDIAHGAGLAIVFPAWMKYVYKHDLDRFVQFAQRVFDVKSEGKDKEKIAQEGIARFELFLKSVGMVTKLSDVKITSKDFNEMAEKATLNSPLGIGSFVKLKKEDIIKIFELCE